MQATLVFLLGISLATGCSSMSTILMDPELISGYTEGDMMIDNFSRNSIKNPWQRWPNCTIRYYIHCKKYDSKQLLSIRKNFDEITKICGLRFEEVFRPVQPLINITCVPNGCFAGIGYRAGGNRLNLQNHPEGVGCFRYGTVGHEISHVLGKFHEHTRPDRDRFIRVLWQNMLPNVQGNFVKKLDKDVDVHGLPYDYGSNMHYGGYGFSKNGQPTIVPMGNAKIGQRVGFSELDKEKLRRLYPGCRK